ncbi:MAG: sigma-70 family RNA polymerase sigma factor [Cyclobacteriaceae bacterium]
MADSSSQTKTEQVVDHFFRHESGRVISHLSSQFGTAHLEEAEDAVQEALIKAMQTWPFSVVPKNPSGWILTVARNKMIDNLRRKQKVVNKEDEEIYRIAESGDTSKMSDVELEDFLKDDVLKMMFACCDPALSVESQIILTLRILCGLGTPEVARALLKKDEAVAKAYTRAKGKLKEIQMKPELPSKDQVKERLAVILKVLYLLFNEGYKSSTGDDLIKKDLCLESMRLNKILCDSPFGEISEINALMALMCFHSSRFEARIGSEGELLNLEDQDRSKWNAELIETGSYYFHRSYRKEVFETMTEYHIQAAMAGLHCRAKDYESTDWEQLLQLYDLQLASRPSPLVELNRLVVFGKVHGIQSAYKELVKLEGQPFLSNYYLFYAVKADFLLKLDSAESAIENYEKAMTLVENLAEKMFFQKKIDWLKSPVQA